MSNIVTIDERRKALAQTASEIDRIASSAMETFDQTGSFQQEIAVAQAMVDLRRCLTPEMMAPIMALMNTDLGFRTDKDPKVINWKTQKPNEPYNVEVVKDVFIESRLRGFRTVGNEFNIISGRFYGAQNGFKRKVKEMTKGTFEPAFGIPMLEPDGMAATVTCSASWIHNGKAGDIGVRPNDPCKFKIRVNKEMGADAIVGKAERKLYKRVHERLTGQIVNDVDQAAEDGVIDVESTKSPFTGPGQTGPSEGPKFVGGATSPRKAKAQQPAPAPAPDTTPAPESESVPPVQETPKTTQPVQSATELPLAGDAQAQDDFGSPEPEQDPAYKASPQGRMEAFFTNAHVSFDAFRKWAASSDRLADAEAFGTWAELPKDFCSYLLSDTKSMNRCVVLARS